LKLRVISFNIRCSNDPNGHSVAERAPRLAEITARYAPDVICFQEYRPRWEEHIEKYYSDTFDMFVKYRNETVDIEASPILWRKDKFECLRTGWFWLSDTPEVESRGWDEKYNCYRMCVYCVLKEKETGTVFTVMNTHFGFGDDGQVKSVKLIDHYRKSVSGYPTFLTGDFNMTPESAGYREMTKRLRDVNACTEKNYSTTYHNYQPEAVTDMHIDYCFVDEAVTPISRVLITDTIDGKFPSDHYGIFMELEVSPL